MHDRSLDKMRVLVMGKAMELGPPQTVMQTARGGQLRGDPHGPLQGFELDASTLSSAFYQVLDIPLWAWTIEFM